MNPVFHIIDDISIDEHLVDPQDYATMFDEVKPKLNDISGTIIVTFNPCEKSALSRSFYDLYIESQKEGSQNT